jgi:hypothetical protein
MLLQLATSHELRGKFIEALDEVQQMNKKFTKLKKKKLCTFFLFKWRHVILSKNISSKIISSTEKSGLGMFFVCSVSEYGKPGEMQSVDQMSRLKLQRMRCN